MRNLLITGGAGFIGSNLVRYMLRKHPDYHLVVYDKLTYAGNLDNLRDIASDRRYAFVKGDICDAEAVESAIRDHKIDTIVNLAAETHVDRSIMDPDAFIKTDVYGTYVLLEAAKKFGLRYHQVGTDEVYGWVEKGSSRETDGLMPRSPYAASKAGADLLIHAYFVTYQVPVTITRGANNIGPYQYPEKVVPLFITNAIDNLPLPVYGDGRQMRDYQYVLDHCEGIDLALHQGKPGEVYNVGTGRETVNLEMARLVLKLLNKPESLIQHVADRPGHDRRYSLDVSKLSGLGWEPAHTFEEALEKTVQWYVENEWWWRKIKSGDYKEYYRKQYAGR
ncbi:MAG: dTDP-glucose 4,6-dehydratase [Chloroflexi bacterium]|nr:dTDP-glucose 4,6-dehydratase [Chloroflexota bacterium]MCL5950480.1 dTDP-glucose 4,6-dehydratase [Chloroflexota bacterium]